MAIVSKTDGTLAMPPEPELLAMVEQTAITQSEEFRNSLETIETAAKNQLEALTKQCEAMEKSVAAAQRALTESRARIAQHPQVSAQKRASERALEQSLQAQIAEAQRTESALRTLAEQREAECKVIHNVSFALHNPDDILNGKYRDTLPFIRRYIGREAYVQDLQRLAKIWPTMPKYQCISQIAQLLS